MVENDAPNTNENHAKAGDAASVRSAVSTEMGRFSAYMQMRKQTTLRKHTAVQCNGSEFQQISDLNRDVMDMMQQLKRLQEYCGTLEQRLSTEYSERIEEELSRTQGKSNDRIKYLTKVHKDELERVRKAHATELSNLVIKLQCEHQGTLRKLRTEFDERQTAELSQLSTSLKEYKVRCSKQEDVITQLREMCSYQETLLAGRNQVEARVAEEEAHNARVQDLAREMKQKESTIADLQRQVKYLHQLEDDANALLKEQRMRIEKLEVSKEQDNEAFDRELSYYKQQLNDLHAKSKNATKGLNERLQQAQERCVEVERRAREELELRSSISTRQATALGELEEDNAAMKKMLKKWEKRAFAWGGNGFWKELPDGTMEWCERVEPMEGTCSSVDFLGFTRAWKTYRNAAELRPAFDTVLSLAAEPFNRHGVKLHGIGHTAGSEFSFDPNVVNPGSPRSRKSSKSPRRHAQNHSLYKVDQFAKPPTAPVGSRSARSRRLKNSSISDFPSSRALTARPVTMSGSMEVHTDSELGWVKQGTPRVSLDQKRERLHMLMSRKRASPVAAPSDLSGGITTGHIKQVFRSPATKREKREVEARLREEQERMIAPPDTPTESSHTEHDTTACPSGPESFDVGDCNLQQDLTATDAKVQKDNRPLRTGTAAERPMLSPLRHSSPLNSTHRNTGRDRVDIDSDLTPVLSVSPKSQSQRILVKRETTASVASSTSPQRSRSVQSPRRSAGAPKKPLTAPSGIRRHTSDGPPRSSPKRPGPRIIKSVSAGPPVGVSRTTGSVRERVVRRRSSMTSTASEETSTSVVSSYTSESEDDFSD
eukprot:Rmarinus@m.16573